MLRRSGASSGVDIRRSNTLEVTITAAAALSHTANHTSACVGTLYQRSILAAVQRGDCPDPQDFNLPVVYSSTHSITHSRVCGNLTRQRTYNGQQIQWWNSDDPPSVPPVGNLETAVGVYIGADNDNDGWEEGDDCDDNFYDPSNQCDYYGACGVTEEQVRECATQYGGAAHYSFEICDCVADASPIIVDLDRDGIQLTGLRQGVLFDLLGSGTPVRTAWTRADTRDAFLVLDRNGDGKINDGTELFGSATAQDLQPGQPPNGFVALARFDQPEYGGNDDGRITAADEVFGRLRLWIDGNHDGVSQPSELVSLAEASVSEIGLHYRLSRRADAYGDVFRYWGAALVTVLEQNGHSRQTPLNTVDVLLAYRQ